MRIKLVYILIAAVIVIILFFFCSTESVRENEKELHALDQTIMLNLENNSFEIVGHEEAGDKCEYYCFDGERVKRLSACNTGEGSYVLSYIQMSCVACFLLAITLYCQGKMLKCIQ